MKLFSKKPYRSARAIIINNGKLLVMHRKRHSRDGNRWLEYYSIPGGGIEAGEEPSDAVTRELHEEMGVALSNVREIAHVKNHRHINHVFIAEVADGIEPKLMPSSEEAKHWQSKSNQFIPKWVPVDELTTENMHYYEDYLPLIKRLANGEQIDEIIEI